MNGSTRRRPLRLSSLAGRFRRSQSGTTAVEFGLIAVPFLGLLFVILETALVFWASQVLETAVTTAARQIYTGQFQTANAGSGLTAAQLQAKLKTAVCANVLALIDCPSTVSVDVQSLSDFPASISLPVTNRVYDTSSYGYSAPQPNQIGLVRASLQYPSFTGFLGSSTGLANGRRLIMATATFRVEPFN